MREEIFERQYKYTPEDLGMAWREGLAFDFHTYKADQLKAFVKAALQRADSDQHWQLIRAIVSSFQKKLDSLGERVRNYDSTRYDYRDNCAATEFEGANLATELVSAALTLPAEKWEGSDLIITMFLDCFKSIKTEERGGLLLKWVSHQLPVRKKEVLAHLFVHHDVLSPAQLQRIDKAIKSFDLKDISQRFPLQTQLRYVELQEHDPKYWTKELPQIDFDAAEPELPTTSPSSAGEAEGAHPGDDNGDTGEIEKTHLKDD